ncbi:MAG: glycosyltransferase family 4 protein [Gammaproteobacteria bacterium]
MPRLRLAFVVSMLNQFGGMQRSLLRIARECQRRGHDVTLYSGELRGNAPEGLKLELLQSRAWSNVSANDRLASAFQRAIRGKSYDCIVGFTKLPGLDVYYAGDPCFAARIAHSKSWWNRLLPRYRGLRRQEGHVFARGRDTEILLFAHQEKTRYQHYYATEEARLHLLPPGINRERLLCYAADHQVRRLVREELHIANTGKMLLMVGGFFHTKGVDRAIRAVAALPQALRQRTVLVVVGGDDSAAFVQLADRLGVAEQLVFTGGREDVGRFYYAADLLIHPSYTENTGSAILEAMVCGLPVLTTDNCGFAGHVEAAQAGRVCPEPFRQDCLNDNLQSLLQSDDDEQLRANARSYTEQTDLYSLIDKAVDVIEARAVRDRGRRLT